MAAKNKRRGIRHVLGYVVSLSGKRGGPYACELWRAPSIEDAERFEPRELERARAVAGWWKANADPETPDARVLPIVRYELDREEERLRDAVVDAAMVFAERMATWERAVPSREKRHELDCDLRESRVATRAAVNALRAHLEEKKR